MPAQVRPAKAAREAGHVGEHGGRLVGQVEAQPPAQLCRQHDPVEHARRRRHGCPQALHAALDVGERALLLERHRRRHDRRRPAAGAGLERAHLQREEGALHQRPPAVAVGPAADRVGAEQHHGLDAALLDGLQRLGRRVRPQARGLAAELVCGQRSGQHAAAAGVRDVGHHGRHRRAHAAVPEDHRAVAEALQRHALGRGQQRRVGGARRGRDVLGGAQRVQPCGAGTDRHDPRAAVDGATDAQLQDRRAVHQVGGAGDDDQVGVVQVGDRGRVRGQLTPAGAALRAAHDRAAAEGLAPGCAPTGAPPRWSGRRRR